MVTDTLREKVKEVLSTLSIPVDTVHLEHPSDIQHGDYSTNVALIASKDIGKNPREIAEEIVSELNKIEIEEVREITVAGPGFINFYLTDDFLRLQLKHILEKEEAFGNNNHLSGKKVMVEYTDPNPFKVFHIGHLMPNVIGEFLVRLYRANGASVIPVNYQGDVGLHVAKAMWGILENRAAFPQETDDLRDRTKYLGDAYVQGARAYEEDEDAKKEIDLLNKKIFEQSDPEIHKLYVKGRQWSLDHFEEIYKELGTSFEHYFFESEVAKRGIASVKEHLEKGTFQESEGAIIFAGEKYGLHTRVFINSLGLPTYEAKDIGLNQDKFDLYPDLDSSLIITAYEQNDYFKVVLKALEEINEEVARRTTHIGHGMLRFTEGKMSSRKGNVVTGESLINDMKALIKEKMKNNDYGEERESIETDVAIAAIKYSILKQKIGKDIVFDSEKSLSFEGDSGPYLQYTTVRAQSVLDKSHKGISLESPDSPQTLERKLYRFPEVVRHAFEDFSPQNVVTYLVDIASEYNSYYAQNKILNSETEPYRLALSKATAIVLQNGLSILGIRLPSKM